jgi:hypothetical protein
MKKKKKVAYVAGRMRGIPYYNFPAFDAAEKLLRSLGYEVINPAELDRQRGFDPLKRKWSKNYDWSQIPKGFKLVPCIKEDIASVLLSDMIYMLIGWDKSVGATAEHAIAKWAGKRIIYQDGQIPFVRSFSEKFLNSKLVPVKETVGPWISTPGSEPKEVRVTDPDTGGQKCSKLARFDLLPADQLWQLAEHYGKAVVSGKYADRNWEKGYNWSLSYAAGMRHANKFWMGEDIDQPTGSKHVIAAAWHFLALAEFMDTHPEKDDRPSTKNREEKKAKEFKAWLDGTLPT